MSTRAGRLLPRRPAIAMPSWSSTRRLRVGLVVVLALAAALVAAYMLWFRDSSFVAVEKVEVTGANVPPGVADELAAAATGLSTLHLDRGAIEAAVAEDPAVAGLKIDTHFPHGITIDVQSRPVAGWIDADGGTLIAADGTVLDTGAERPQGTPEIAGEGSIDARVQGPELTAAKVLGAAPAPLRAEIAIAEVDREHGVVAELTGGIELRFGSPAAAAQKWRAAAAVLADPELTSATYIDLSAPARPVVG
ncbi:MAG TPA: cell division protein FtsQ/DivIB [Solirubrobacterales bacterium]|nr:cell division protein FtsQ/DivIB [Solirubrobacterales bacterium]